MVAVHARLAIHGEQDRPNAAYAGGVGGHKFFPQCLVAGGEIQAIDSRRQLSRPVDINYFAVLAPLNGLPSHLKTWNRTRLTSCNRINVRLLIRSDADHLLSV